MLLSMVDCHPVPMALVVRSSLAAAPAVPERPPAVMSFSAAERLPLVLVVRLISPADPALSTEAAVM
jgi:hypothetical protein